MTGPSIAGEAGAVDQDVDGDVLETENGANPVNQPMTANDDVEFEEHEIKRLRFHGDPTSGRWGIEVTLTDALEAADANPGDYLAWDAEAEELEDMVPALVKTDEPAVSSKITPRGQYDSLTIRIPREVLEALGILEEIEDVANSEDPDRKDLPQIKPWSSPGLMALGIPEKRSIGKDQLPTEE